MPMSSRLLSTVESQATRYRHIHLRSTSFRLARGYRYNSSRESSGFGTHLLAGFAGASLVVASGYTWYYFSGVKKAIDAARSAKIFLQQSRQQLQSKPINALSSLRQAAKSYVAIIPFAGIFVDKAFDSIDKVVDAHSDEAAAIATKTYEDLLDVIEQHDDKAGPQTAFKILQILTRDAREITAIGLKVGEGVVEPLANKFPAVQDAAKSSFDGIKSYTQAKLPEVRQVFDSRQQQVKTFFKSRKNDDSSITEASSQTSSEEGSNNIP